MRITIVLAIIAICVFSVYGCLFCLNDFPQIYTAAQLFLTNKTSAVYVPAEFIAHERSIFPQLAYPVYMAYPPFSLFLIAPLALFPSPTAIVLWAVVGVALLIASCAVLGVAYKLKQSTVLMMILLVVSSGQFFQTLFLKQQSFYFLFGMALLVWALRTPEQAATKRALLAVPSFLLFLPKLHLLAPLLCYLLGGRRCGVLAVFLSVLSFAVAISLIYPGADTYHSFFSNLQWWKSHLLEVQDVRWSCTLSGQIVRFAGVNSLQSLVATIGFLCSLIGLFVLGARFAASPRYLDYGLCLIPASFFLHMYMYPYDTLLLLPSVLSALSLQTVAGANRSRALVAGCFSCFCLPVYLLAWRLPSIDLIAWFLCAHAIVFARLVYIDFKTAPSPIAETAR